MSTKVTPIDHKIAQNLIDKRIIMLHREIGVYSVVDTLEVLYYMTSKSNKPITLQLCSPGGSVDDGIALYDFIKSSKVQINTHCTGFSASMAAILLAAGAKGKRTASKNSRIMIHQPSSGYIGKAIDIEIHAQETNRIRTLLARLLSNDTKQDIKKVLKDMEKDYWMTAEEAKKYGIIDRVI